MNDNEEQIKQQLLNAHAAGDIDGVVRALRDLESIGWTKVRVCSRVIGRNGEKIEYYTFMDGRIRIVGGSLAFRLIWTLRFRGMFKRNDHRYLKHQNEMSPEEYEWVFL